MGIAWDSTKMQDQARLDTYSSYVSANQGPAFCTPDQSEAGRADHGPMAGLAARLVTLRCSGEAEDPDQWRSAVWHFV